MQRRSSSIPARLAAALAAGLALLVVFELYASDNPVLAAACLAGFALAFYVYSSTRTYSARYLFPGLSGIALFVVLPLLYTVWISFTNYSSTNLLTFERATEVLLSELYQDESAARYQLSLHRDGVAFRIVLRSGDDEPAPADDGPGMMGPDPTATDDAVAAPAADAGAAPAPPPPRPAATAFVSPPLPLTGGKPITVTGTPLATSGFSPGEALGFKELAARSDAIKAITVQLPDGSFTRMQGLREFTQASPLYQRNADGSLTNARTKQRLIPNQVSGFYELPGGEHVIPGFRTSVGLGNYTRILTDPKFSGPFLRVFLWTIVFAGITVVMTAGLGMLLAELLSWEGLRFATLYRVLLFLPYAVPGFISILVFKGLFNHSFGEINLILDTLFGIRPDWITNPILARLMILIVNTWLGYPYFMLLCMGLQKSISRDLYEASALAGAGPITNFFQITWPLIKKPLTPLLVSSFAFNFNNFVLIYLLTKGRPDFLDTSVPAGETDILVSYTYRIAFEDSGQQFGLAAAISTLIFAMVAVLSVVNLRLTKANAPDKR
jgi:maltose/maltodextrin transport system permease protein